jgi:hypothetical protein
MPVLHPVLKWLSPNISPAVGKEKATAVETDFSRLRTEPVRSLS